MCAQVQQPKTMYDLKMKTKHFLFKSQPNALDACYIFPELSTLQKAEVAWILFLQLTPLICAASHQVSSACFSLQFPSSSQRRCERRNPPSCMSVKVPAQPAGPAETLRLERTLLLLLLITGFLIRHLRFRSPVAGCKRVLPGGGSLWVGEWVCEAGKGLRRLVYR